MIRNLGFLGYDKYAVTTCGKVYSLYNNRFLKTALCDQGYPQVTLSSDEGPRAWRVHRLVALAFVPNPANKTFVNHLDGDKTNNHAWNLEWCTPSENTQHAFDTGLIEYKPREGSKFSSRQLDDQTIHSICKMLEEGHRVKDIAETCGVKPQIVSHIRHGDIYRSISKQYDMKRSGKKKLISLDKVIRICELLEKGYSYSRIAREVGCSAMTPRSIKLRKSHTDVSCTYHW